MGKIRNIHHFINPQDAFDRPSGKDRDKGGVGPNLELDGSRSPYFSTVRLFPSIITLLKTRFIRVW